MRYASKVIIVPGYGMAVAQAQHTVYEITKALFSDAAQAQLAAGHAKGKFITKENAVKGAGIPFHPGAEKFYKEVGLVK